jgi:copper/silver efflux system protein
MVGGMISSTVLTLGVIPALYALVKQWQLGRASRSPPLATADIAQSEAATS